MTTEDVPNPGSQEAIDAGCTCPVLDNARGKGYMGMPGVFVFHMGCPVHHPERDDQVEEKAREQGETP